MTIEEFLNTKDAVLSLLQKYSDNEAINMYKHNLQGKSPFKPYFGQSHQTFEVFLLLDLTLDSIHGALVMSQWPVKLVLALPFI